uniref:hAT-like transposase RNase-H fold domain-containing protein n=1 Tax=Lactuca sativa TaxID=4236 RepID=A0A9R1VFN6_LACSA|nr:hypothetical protein LSAT_V11C500240100 [Lactuca sativa]
MCFFRRLRNWPLSSKLVAAEIANRTRSSPTLSLVWFVYSTSVIAKHILRTLPDNDLPSTSTLRSSVAVRHRAPSSDIKHLQSIQTPAIHLQFFTEIILLNADELSMLIKCTNFDKYSFINHVVDIMDGDVSSDLMEGVENKEKFAPINVDADEQPTPHNHIPSKNGSGKHQNAEIHGGEEEIVMKQKRKKIKGMGWFHYSDSIKWSDGDVGHEKLPSLIRPDAKLQKRVLSFVHVPPPRTGLDIADGEFHEGVKYNNNSEERLQIFSNITHQLQIQDRKLLLDVPTRWNSTYDMLSVTLKFKDVFPRFAEYEPHFHHLPNDEEWAHVESVCEILKVCTNVISGSDYPTSNLYLIEVFRVKETLDKDALSKNDFIKTMVTKTKEKFVM